MDTLSAPAFPDLKPFPSAAAPVAASSSEGAIDSHHNRPPLDEMIVGDFMEGLREDPRLLARIDELIAKGAAPAPCDSDDLAGRYGDFVKMVRTCADMVEAEREKHNRPLLTAQRTLKAKADSLTGPLAEAAARVRARLDKFVRDQSYIESIIQHIRNCGMGMIDGKTYPYPILIRELEEKVVVDAETFGTRAKEVEKLRVETLQSVKEAFERHMARAEDKAEPVAPEPVSAPVEAAKPVARGDYGSRVGATTTWHHQIESVRKLPDRLLKHPKVVEALDKVIAAEIRGGAREIPGCRIWSEQKAAVR